MTRRKFWIAAGLTLLVGSAALALAPGEPVYVKTKNTRIFKKPDAAAPQLGNPVQPGTKLVWNGRVKNADLPWQQVTVHGKKGYVLGANLSLTRPSTALTASTESEGHLDAEEIASSGDAVKALGDGAKAYGAELKHEQVVPQIEALEKIGKKVGADRKGLYAFQRERHLNTAGVGGGK